MRLEGRIALITGASRGLGRAVALRFAEEGARLVLVARTQGALEEVDDEIRARGGEATLVVQDLTDHAMIDSLGAALAERFGRLDVLVHAAGELGVLAPVGHIRPEVYERTMAIEATATYRLIRSLDPLLRASGSGSLIAVTADVARTPRPYWGLMAAAKAATEALVLAYAEETRRMKLRVNLVDPGPMRTRLRAGAYPGEDPQTVPPPESVTDLFVDLAEAGCTRHGEVVRATFSEA
jgi:NAD(P)-dependent dehydrogenase (short-subunit alcohol dehydrogenase family)